LYHNLGNLSRGFLHFFSSLRRWVSGSDRQIYPLSAGSDFGGTPCAPLPLTPLLYHTLRDLSRGLLKKIATFFQRAVPYTVWAWLRHTDFSVLYPNGTGLNSSSALPS
jgi:hypothetical protein